MRNRSKTHHARPRVEHGVRRTGAGLPLFMRIVDTTDPAPHEKQPSA